jgi:hypothetical protein
MKTLSEFLGQQISLLSSQDLYDFLRVAKPSIYHKFEIDLTIPRLDQEFKIQGTFFQILQISQGAKISVRFNEPFNQPILFDNTQLIFIPFYRFFVSNEVQVGKTATLFVGDNIAYLPFIRIENVDLSELNKKTLNPLSSNLQITRVVVSTTPTQIKSTEPTRRAIIIQNMSDTNLVFIGKDNSVSSSNGYPIFPFGALSLSNEKVIYIGEIWAVAQVDTEIAVLSFYE